MESRYFYDPWKFALLFFRAGVSVYLPIPRMFPLVHGKRTDADTRYEVMKDPSLISFPLALSLHYCMISCDAVSSQSLST